MDQLPFDTPKRGRGGDTHSPQAKVDIAKRENQIVELRLRNISFAAIGRAVEVRAYGDTFASRHDDKKQGATVIVMQRVNDNDLSAHVLALKEEHYVHLKIEAEATSHTTITFPRTGHILVREPQELLWPTREGPLEIARQKAVMGRWTYAAQYQQDPIPEGGSIFQREWFSHCFHRDPDTGIPLGAKLRMVIQSWDTAAKKKESNDYWACTTWGRVVDTPGVLHCGVCFPQPKRR